MKFIYFFLLYFLTFSLFGQNNENTNEKTSESIDNLLEMNLDDLLNIDVSVATKKKTSIRETPGIISVITKDDIKKSGARDLIDLLIKVPGLNFGTDVQGIVGISVRGNWAHEGKVLLLINGQEMNELMFSTLQFGNHYPVDIIKKIEIIRGPGSSIYGGFAELSVINIILEDGEDINGYKIGGIYTQTDVKFDKYSHRNFNISIGEKVNDFQISGHIFTGKGIRSDESFNDFYENSYSMSDNSQLNPTFASINLSYKNFSLKFIYDNYELTQQDGFYVNLPKATEMNFKSYYFESKYDLKINDKLIITPKFNYKRQNPWNSKGDYVKYLETNEEFDGAYGGLYSDTVVERYVPSLTISYDFMEKNNILIGSEYIYDTYFDQTTLDGSKSNKIHYVNIAVFAQTLISTPYVDITAGMRYDNHSEAGSKFVPRIAFTKSFDKFHTKLLFSKAFRQPGFANIMNFKSRDGESDSIKPETTTVIEFEAGYKLTKKMFVTADFFHIDIEDPIVYYYEDGDSYDNYSQTGTQGFEVEYIYKDWFGDIKLNYSFYRAYNNDVDSYKVSKDENVLLGFSPHKFVLSATFTPLKNLFVNFDSIYLSSYYGYNSVDSDDNLLLQKFDGYLKLNLFITYNNIISEGFDIGAGIYNILNTTERYIQAYDGYHASIFAPKRDFVFKLTYHRSF